MRSLDVYLKISKPQKLSILILIGLVLLLQYVYYNYEGVQEEVLDINSPHIIALQQYVDSLKQEELKTRRSKIFPFNPNFISDYRGYTLGMSLEEINKLHHYRAQDRWVNSVSDFKRVTGVSDSLLAIISPYFKFPEWIRQSKPNAFKQKKTILSFNEKEDLNVVTAKQLETVYGIGKKLSQRIIKYRQRIQGFFIDEQLNDVYGLKEEVISNILDRFTVKNKPLIEKINVNTATASDLATLVYINFELAAEIVEYRTLHERFSSLEELKKIEGFPVRKINRIALYLKLN